MSLTKDALASHERTRRAGSPQSSLLSPRAQPLSPGNLESNQSFHLDSASDAGSTSRKSTHSKRAPSTAQDSAENVKVICRVRPFNPREFALHDEMNAKCENEWDKKPLRSVIEMEGNNTIFLDHEKDYAERDRFSFDASLWSMPDEQQASPNGFASQEDVMQQVGEVAINHIWNGFNTTVFAYGQTGSGKTYSMMGTETDPGLIPRICKELFVMYEDRKEADREKAEDGTVKEYKLEARFLEIYNERIRDLLWAIRPEAQPTEGLDHLNLKVRNIPNVGPQVQGITCITVDSSDDCLKLIEEGTRHRSVAATKMNAESSRSHSIFRLTLTQTTKVLPTKQFEKPKSYDRTSVISLVDLAGSERNKKTGAEGARLKEAVAINQSLTSLKNVIDALVEGRTVIPFRDSQLTWLLSESLGGNSKTFMIACVSPHSDNGEESLNTLRYAARAQKIINHASVNESEEMRRMNKMREELDRLQRQMNENPDEGILQEEFQEQQRKLQELKEEGLRKQHEAEILAQAAGRHDDMRFTQSYQHAFRVCMYKRFEKKYREHNAMLKQRVEMRKGETDRLSNRVQEADATTAQRKKEEADAKAHLDSLENKMKLLQQNCAALEEQKGELVAKEDRLKDAQEKKMKLVGIARNIGKVLCAHRRYVFDNKVERMNEQKRHDLKALSDEQVNWNLNAEEKHLVKMSDLKAEGQRLREKLEALKHDLKTTTKRKSEEITKLHAACIFFENETKRCLPDLERGLATVNKACSARFYEDKEKWAEKINKLAVELEKKTSRTSEEYQSRHSAAGLRGIANLEAVEHAGEDAYDSAVRNESDKLVTLDADWERRLLMLEALNVDTNEFLKETRHAEPRYRKIFEDIAYLVDPAKELDTHVKEIGEQLRKVCAQLESVAPQPFKLGHGREIAQCDQAPLFGQPPTPRRRRTLSPSPNVRQESQPQSPTARRTTSFSASATLVASPVTPGATPRSGSPSATIRRPPRERTMTKEGPFATKREVEKPASLAPPKRLIPTTTKTSRLRNVLLTDRHLTSSTNGRSTTPTPSPSKPAATERSMTPRTARETLEMLLDEEPKSKKVHVGNGAYMMSRSRSPASTRPLTVPVAPRCATPRGNRSDPQTPPSSARRSLTPRR